MWCEAKGEKGEKEEGKETDTWGPARQRERKRKRAPTGWDAVFSSLLGLVGPAADLGNCWPKLEGMVLKFVLKSDLIYCLNLNYIQIQTSHT
jgi:hypothetical protein